MNSQEPLSFGAAEYLLSFRFGESDVIRMNELSELAQQGKLTAEEQVELDSYKSKGRRALNQSGQ